MFIALSTLPPQSGSNRLPDHRSNLPWLSLSMWTVVVIAMNPNGFMEEHRPEYNPTARVCGGNDAEPKPSRWFLCFGTLILESKTSTTV